MSHPCRLGQDLRQFVFVACGFFAALIFSSAAQGAIAFEQASSAATKSSSRSLGWNHVLGAGNNRVVIVGVTLDDNPSRQRERITVTFNGAALRAIPNADADAPGRDDLTTRLFYALESSLPPVGAGRIEIRLSNKAQTIIGTAMSFAGVEQGVPRPADGNAFWRDSHSVRTRLKTEIPGSWIVDVVGADDDDPLSPTTPGQTKRVERLGRRLSAAGSTLVAPDPSWQTVGWTHRTRDQLVHAAAVLRPVRYDLQVSIVGAGTVAPGGGTFIGDSIVSLRATPAAGNRFLSWSGDLAGAANPALLTMDSDKHVTATFVRLVSLTTATNGNGAIAVDPAGPVYDAGTTVTLTASAAPGNRFTGWSGALSSTDNPATLTLNADAAVTANFIPLATLTTATNGNGTVTLDPAGPVYDVGTTVTLTATAGTGHRFTGWSGALSGSANSATLVLAGDASVMANFVAVYAVVTSVTGQGAIALDPVAGTYDAGTVVNATATPATGWQFSGWSGDLTGNTNPAALTVDANKTITAAFTEIAPPVAGITFDASASGTVVAGTTITWPHVIGSGASRAVVVGVAVEDNSAAEMTVASATFNGTPLLAIAGTKISGGNSTNRDQSELFYLLEAGLPVPGTYNVVVTFAGAVDGAVGGSTSLIGAKQTAPEAATSKSDTSGADVISTNITTLTAGAWIVDVVTSGNTGAFTPSGEDQTERFDLSVAAVTSGMAGAGSTRTVATPGVTAMAWAHVNANRLMHSLAAFAPAIDLPLPTFGLTVATNGSGSVAVNPALATYPAGSLVTLTATADAGFQFAGWSGDLASTANPATLTMDAAKSVTATFTPVAPTTYTLTINVTGSGTVVRNPDLAAYSPGAIVDLVAVPAVGWSFTGWSGDLSGAATPNTITMDGNKVVTATFTADSGGAPDFGLYGWATTGAGTTGGAGGAEVVVNTLEDFKFYAGQTTPYIIKISGTIVGNEDVRVRSNKSILGLGSDARFLGVGLSIGWNSEFGQINNIIIRNVTFEKAIAPIDCVAIAYGAHHVWVDHCDFFSERNGNIDFYDGLLDVTHGADFVTVSWCKFYEHYKTSLVGHSENNAAEDVGHLTVTYHHNSFIDSGGRNPSVRFGTVHVFNNYYLDLDDYGIASRQNAEVLIENNYFENVNRPIRADTSLSDVAGRVRGVATNIFVNCGPNSITSPEATWVPPYPYALTPAADVPALVNAWAGVGILTFTGTPPPPVQPTIITAPAAQTGTAGESVTFSVTAGGTGPFAYQWKKNGADISGATGASYTIAVVQASDAGAYSVLITGPGGSITTTPVTLTVNAAPPPINAAILLRERFADGDRTTQALPDSAAWFTSAGSSNFTATVGAATLNLSSSRTLLAYVTNGTDVTANVAPGQTLTWDIVVQFTGVAPTGNLNLGLFRSVANPAAIVGTGFVPSGPPNTNARVTGDFGSGAPASGVFSLYQGYAAFATTSASATPARLFARTGSDANILSSTGPMTLLGGGAPTPSTAFAAGVDYRLTFTLSNTGSGMDLVVSATNLADSSIAFTFSARDPATTFTAFDTIAFYKASGGATNLVIKSADVSLAGTLAGDAPMITSQPAPQTVLAGQPASFSVVASGTEPLSYRWQKNGAVIGGATSATFALASAQPSDAGTYRVTVSNDFGSALSNVALLTVNVPAVGPTITSQPASQTVAVGTNVTFNVMATGTAPLSYAWQKDGAPITGANGASLTLTNVQPADAGSYTVVVSNIVDSVTSDAALLTVNETPVGPTITVDPAGRSAFTGETVSFTVVATGTAPLTYAWTKDGAAITGADAATLALTNVALTDAGTYAAVVTNAVNSATSAGAVLTVAASPAAPGDIFVAPGGLAANPGTIALPTTFTNALTLIAPGSTIWMRGGTYAFSPQISIARTNAGLAGARKNIFAFAGEHPVLDFSSQPYGSTSSVSNPRGLQINGHFWHVRDLEVKGSADNGIYIGGNDNIIERCVTHSNRDSGLQLGRFSGSALRSEWPSFNLILNCESYDNYDSPPNGGENADGFACKLTTGAGNVFRGCIAHHNIDDGWDLFTNTDTGPIDPVVIDQCIAYQNGQLTNGTSSSAGDRNGFKLGGNSIPVIHTVTRSIAFGNGKNGFTFNSNPAAIRLINNLAFDNTQGNFKFDQPGPLFLNNVSLYTVGTGQNDRYGGNSGIATGPSNCFWFTGSSSRGPSINDQGLTVSTASFVTLALPAGGFARAADGAIAPGNFGRPIAGSLLINAGEIPPAAILVELPFDVSTWYEGLPDIGVVETFLLVATPPSILLQPASQAVAEGGNAAFTVLATGSIPLAYQWSKDGVVLPGETQSTLDLVGVQPADGGVYTVIVSNPFGTAPSDPATLTIGLPVAPAIITPPASKTVTVGATVSFTVEATGTAPLGYQWSKDGVNLPSANADTLVLSDVQLVDAGSYVVTVSNLVTSVASAPATLTVNAPVPATILLQERFADGDRTSQALPASAAWFTSAGSSNFTATVGAATQNISSSRTLVAYFTNGAGAPVLVESAQVLTLDLVVQFTGGDPIGNLNFGLMRSVANPAAVNGTGFTASGAPNTNARVTGDFGSGAPASHVFANYSGYAALGTASASATPVRLYARTGANDNIISSTAPFVQLTSTGTGSPGLVAGVDYRLTLTVAHTGAGMAIAFDVTRVSDGAVVMSQSALDAAATFTEFDTLVFYKASGGATNLVIKSADVDLITPAP